MEITNFFLFQGKDWFSHLLHTHTHPLPFSIITVVTTEFSATAPRQHHKISPTNTRKKIPMDTVIRRGHFVCISWIKEKKTPFLICESNASHIQVSLKRLPSLYFRSSFLHKQLLGWFSKMLIFPNCSLISMNSLTVHKKLLTFNTFTNLLFILLASWYSILPLIPKLLAIGHVLF